MNPASSAAALSQLQGAESTAQDPNTILSGQQQQLGVPAAQQTVTGLRGAINNTTKLLQQVAPSVMGRTGTSLVTNAQATRQIENEQAPLNTTLGNDTTQYNQAGEDLANLESQAEQAATGIYQGQQDKLSYAQNLYNSLYQQEQDAQAEKDKQAQMAEAIREANLTASKSGSGGTTFNLGGAASTPAPTSTTDPATQTAYNDVKNLLSKDPARIQQEYEAIKKSAGYGNAYDKIKQQLIEQLYPAALKFGQGVTISGVSNSPVGIATF